MRKVFFILFFILIVPSSFAQETLTQAQFIRQINKLVVIGNESLNDDDVNSIARNVLPNRQQYPNEVIAKLFLLLADIEINKGDINAAFQYAQEGIATPTSNKKIKLCLQLKLAELLIIKKQYTKLYMVAQQAVLESEQVNQVKYKLFSLSYRSVALATLGQHQQALVDLQQVEQDMITYRLFNDHIKLFTILASAYYQLSDYQTVLTLQLKILKLRFELEQKENIEKTYLALGDAYINLRRFDDAYNAFWEAKYYSEKKIAPINVAYANKGLGISLIKQKRYSEAVIVLQQAAEVFQQENLDTVLIETLVALAKAKLNSDKKSEGHLLLINILTLLDGKTLSSKYLGFYRMVAAMHFAQGNYQEAYIWQKKHSQLLLIKIEETKKSATSVRYFYNQPLSRLEGDQSIIKSRKLAVKLAENNELSQNFTLKLHQQKSIIISLIVLVILLIITFFGFIIKLKSKKRALVYETEERPSYILASPMQTKHDYQLAFKKARIYQYPFTASYFVIENWQELTFLCNKRSLKEVRGEIASVINKQLTEFDQAGLLNDGEYLLWFEHQDEDEINEKITNLAQELSVRFFANLGDFSVTINYGLKTPDFKDIDPYVFLARLCETVASSKPLSK